MLIASDGPATYRSTIGGTLSLNSSQRLLGLRVITTAGEGGFTINPPSSGESVFVSASFPFDWNPSYKVVASTLTFTTGLRWFAEVETSA